MISFLSSTVVTEVGKALIVAGLLSGTVDIYLKRRMAADFIRDVSHFIEGIELPRGFQEEISFLRRIYVYRAEFELFYRLVPLAEHPHYYRLYVSVSYQIVNQLDQLYSYSHRLFCEDEFPEIEQSKIINAGVKGKGISTYSYSRAENNFPANTLSRTGTTEEFVLDVLIPPNKETYRTDPIVFWGEMSSIQEENDGDVFYFTHPTLNPTIRVEYPDDLAVTVYIGHRFQDSAPGKITKVPPTGKTHTWTLSAALVPWQSVLVEWKKRKPPLGETSRPTGVGKNGPLTLFSPPS
jgi:hypothetical protein